jgi:hypothetical protein
MASAAASPARAGGGRHRGQGRHRSRLVTMKRHRGSGAVRRRIDAETGPRDAAQADDLIQLRFVAAVGLVVLNVVDLLLTRELLAQGAVEANPLMAMVIGGFWGVAIKLGVPILAGLRSITSPLHRKAVFAFCWVNVLYLGVVAWNFHVLAGR